MSETARSSRAGTQFGRFRLKRLLGRGGMGEVYEAEDTEKDRMVALKLMSAQFSQDPEYRKRMQREAHTAGRLQEPHVVPIHDYGEIDGQLYLEMRLIEGANLHSLLQRFGPLDPPRAVAIIRQVASALDAAHAAGVMHRDIKPENVLITRDDFAYLVDFGIAHATTDARLTQLGIAVGTRKYMAPERFSNAEVTYRADIYALACVLHECLTGSPPYRADSDSALITAHLMQPAPRPSQMRPGIPRAFDAVIARGMAKKPENRYASAGDLSLAAHRALTTPDQDQAATLLRRSQESVLPGAGSTVTLPAAAPPPAPTRKQPSAAPPPSPTWKQPAAAPPPSPTWKQPAAAPPPTPAWHQLATTPPSSPTWNQPQPQAPAKRWPTSRWIILGGAGLAVSIAIVVVGVFILWPPKRPLVTANQLSSILLDPNQINDIMGASNMQSNDRGDKPSTDSSTLSKQECLGALYAGMKAVYASSGYTAFQWMTLSEPGNNFDHFVDQEAAVFPSADKASAFVTSSAAQWKTCAGNTVTVSYADASGQHQQVRYSIGNLTGDAPKISQLDTQVSSDGSSVGWACQRALSAVNNVVIDVRACEKHIADQASRIAEAMAVRAAHSTSDKA